MTPKTKKRTCRTEPVEAPPPQRTCPNTPEPTPVVTELQPAVLKEIEGLVQSATQQLWECLDCPPTSDWFVPIQLCHTLFHTFVDNFLQTYNDGVLQLQKADMPTPDPLPPYSTSRATTPVPPPPLVSKSEATVQTDEETLPNPPPQRTYAQAATMTVPEAPPRALGSPPPPRPHPSCSHPPSSKPSAPATLPSRPSPKMMGQCVVVHIGKSTFYSSRLGVPAILPKLHKDISDALEKEGEILKCLGVKLSHSKNLIIMFPTKLSKSTIAAAFPTLCNTLLLPQSVRLSFDTPWSYLSFANVPTRLSPDDMPFKVLELLQEVCNNLALKDMAFTHLPSWVSDPKHLAKPRSSIAFAFEDPTGSLLWKVKQTECLMSGTAVHIQDWSPRPPSSQPRPASGPMDTSS